MNEHIRILLCVLIIRLCLASQTDGLFFNEPVLNKFFKTRVLAIKTNTLTVKLQVIDINNLVVSECVDDMSEADSKLISFDLKYNDAKTYPVTCGSECCGVKRADEKVYCIAKKRVLSWDGEIKGDELPWDMMAQYSDVVCKSYGYELQLSEKCARRDIINSEIINKELIAKSGVGYVETTQSESSYVRTTSNTGEHTFGIGLKVGFKATVNLWVVGKGELNGEASASYTYKASNTESEQSANRNSRSVQISNQCGSKDFYKVTRKEVTRYSECTILDENTPNFEHTSIKDQFECLDSGVTSNAIQKQLNAREPKRKDKRVKIRVLRSKVKQGELILPFRIKTI